MPVLCLWDRSVVRVQLELVMIGQTQLGLSQGWSGPVGAVGGFAWSGALPVGGAAVAAVVCLSPFRCGHSRAGSLPATPRSHPAPPCRYVHLRSRHLTRRTGPGDSARRRRCRSKAPDDEQWEDPVLAYIAAVACNRALTMAALMWPYR